MRHPSFLAFGAFCTLALLGSSQAAAQPARLERTDLPPSAIALTDLRAFRPTSANWRIAGDASADRARPLALLAEPGTGVLVNVPTDAAKGHLLTTWEHGDLDLSLDVMVPKTSNSGIYLMGQYEVQVFDSFGKPKEKLGPVDMGGIYSTKAPSENASKAPGEWQTFDITFRAPRFDASGKKTENAKFIKVVLNGKTIHENVEAPKPTGSELPGGEKPQGPLMLQGDHKPIAYRNVWVKPTGEGK